MYQFDCVTTRDALLLLLLLLGLLLLGYYRFTAIIQDSQEMISYYRPALADVGLRGSRTAVIIPSRRRHVTGNRK